MSKSVPMIHYTTTDKKVGIVYASDVLRTYFEEKINECSREDNREFIADWVGDRGIIVDYGSLRITHDECVAMATDNKKDFIVIMDIE